jgi:glycosyltransferase involved in cell wall biosynthesis
MALKVSVVVPVYNVEIYLRRCLDSLINQTYKDIEFICVNDGSTDSSLEILKEYAAKDPRFIIINQENQGVACAKNNGLNAASGDYLSFVDSDDWVDLNYYEEVVNEFTTTNCDVVQLDYTEAYFNNDNYVNDVQHFDKFIEKISAFNLKNHEIYSINSFKKLEYFPVKMSCCDKVYNLNFIKKNNICFGFKNFGEDNIFSVKSFVLASKVVYLKKSFYYYFSRYNSLVHNKDYTKLKDLKINMNLVIDFLKELNDKRFDKCLNNYIYSKYEYFYKTTCPAVNKTSLRREMKTILEPYLYRQFIQDYLFVEKVSFFERILSLKNVKHRRSREKVLSVLGKRFVLKRSLRY